MTENEEKRLMENAYTLRRELIQKMLNDTRDIDLECGYPSAIKINDYATMFDRNGVGTRVVKLWPEECWNVIPEIVEDEKNETSFEKKWKELDKKFHISDYLYRIDVLSGIGRFGVLLLGVNDGKKLSEPLDKKNCELIYLKPLSEYVVTVKDKEKEATSPRFGLPTRYALKTEAVDGEMNAGETEVHWTRVIHVADNRGVSETFGTPRLEPVYNYVLDLKKTLGGSAEMFWKGGFPGYAFEATPERTDPLTTEEKAALREEFLNFSNKLQRYIALVGVTAKSMTPQIADPQPQFSTQLKAMCVTLGVPYRVFMGTEESKLAGSQDDKRWNRRVSKRQNSYLTPRLVRPLVDRLIELGVLPEAGYEVKWPSLEELDPKEASEVAKNKTEAMTKYAAAGVEAVMGPRHFLTLVLGFTDDEADDITKEAETWVDDHLSENDLEDVPKEDDEDKR